MHPIDALEAVDVIALTLGGAAAGFVNTLAGGGSALALALLVFTGVDATAANGTNRVAVFAQAASAVTTFHRRGVRPWRGALSILPVVLTGAVIGALVAARLPSRATQWALGALFAGLAVVLAVRPGWLVPEVDRAVVVPADPRLSHHAAAFGVGLYGGMFQAGVGIPLLLVVVHRLRLDLVAGNAAKSALVLIFTGAALVVFGGSGQVDWTRGAILAAGGWVGSAVAARTAVARGAVFVRRVLVLALIVSAAKFLGAL